MTFKSNMKPSEVMPAHACAYCNDCFPASELTRDHVVPRAFWAGRGVPDPPILVPACQKCHSDLDKEVSYFRDAIVKEMEWGSDRDVLDEKIDLLKVKRSIARRKGPHPVYWGYGFDADGKFMPRPVRCLDWAKLELLLKKISRGMFFYERGCSLSKDAVVFGRLTRPIQLGFSYLSIRTSWENRWSSLDPNVFEWQSSFSESDPNGSQWLFRFYKTEVFFVGTRTRYSAGIAPEEKYRIAPKFF